MHRSHPWFGGVPWGISIILHCWTSEKHEEKNKSKKRNHGTLRGKRYPILYVGKENHCKQISCRTTSALWPESDDPRALIPTHNEQNKYADCRRRAVFSKVSPGSHSCTPPDALSRSYHGRRDTSSLLRRPAHRSTSKLQIYCDRVRGAEIRASWIFVWRGRRVHRPGLKPGQDCSPSTVNILNRIGPGAPVRCGPSLTTEPPRCFEDKTFDARYKFIFQFVSKEIGFASGWGKSRF